MTRSRIVRICIPWLIVAAGAALYFIFDPAVTRWAPKCMFRVLTGYDCPGCGSQRALHALLHADMAGAWHANAFLFCSLPLIGVMAFASIFHKRYPRLYMRVNSLPVIITFVTALVIWGILRNFFC